MNNYIFFIDLMNKKLKEYKKEYSSYSHQKYFNQLIKLEKQFKHYLQEDKLVDIVYNKFIDFILSDRQKILSSFPYFRERETKLSKNIFVFFKKRNVKKLFNLRINYNFINWSIKNILQLQNDKYYHLLNDIIHIRQIMCIMLLPLAVNRTTLFAKKNKYTNLEYQDYLLLCSEAILIAIDKFVPPYKSSFLSVIIGRMLIQMLNFHNAMPVKLSSTDQRILYRVNLAIHKHQCCEHNQIVSFVNEKFQNVSSNDIHDLLNASAMVDIYEQPLESSTNLEEICSNKELFKKLFDIIYDLPIIQRKILQLKFGLLLEDYNDFTFN